MEMRRQESSDRIATIDALRGLAIFGMILCAYIGWQSGLPAWMFHAQLPPPDYVFSPEVRGITWVDLVFPFFLFSMGAAFPFALRKRLAKGAGTGRIVVSLLKRWAVLACFSIVLGNANSSSVSEAAPVWKNLFMIFAWCGLFLALARFNFKSSRMNAAAGLSGVVMLVAAAFIMQYGLKVPLSKDKCDAIIMILAYVSLGGSLIWMLTKDSLPARWCIFAAVALIKALDSYTGIFRFVPGADEAGYGWIFKFEYLQYILIAIPGSVAGDLILRRKNSRIQEMPAGWRTSVSAALAMAAVLLQLWGLFTRHVAADLILTVCLSCLAAVLVFVKKRPADGGPVPSAETWAVIMFSGLALMIAGIIFDPIDGGIRKDWCNLSYLLTTCGMAGAVAGVFMFIETKAGIRMSWLCRCGQNPMLAYTVTGYLIVPVLSLAGLAGLLFKASAGSPVMGLVQGFIFTGLMMAVTIFFTDRRLFWRS